MVQYAQVTKIGRVCPDVEITAPAGGAAAAAPEGGGRSQARRHSPPPPRGGPSNPIAVRGFARYETRRGDIRRL
jgi:hypothetical protein